VPDAGDPAQFSEEEDMKPEDLAAIGAMVATKFDAGIAGHVAPLKTAVEKLAGDMKAFSEAQAAQVVADAATASAQATVAARQFCERALSVGAILPTDVAKVSAQHVLLQGQTLKFTADGKETEQSAVQAYEDQILAQSRLSLGTGVPNAIRFSGANGNVEAEAVEVRALRESYAQKGQTISFTAAEKRWRDGERAA
jgi:hypothetical protein